MFFKDSDTGNFIDRSLKGSVEDDVEEKKVVLEKRQKPEQKLVNPSPNKKSKKNKNKNAASEKLLEKSSSSQDEVNVEIVGARKRYVNSNPIFVITGKVNGQQYEDLVILTDLTRATGKDARTYGRIKGIEVVFGKENHKALYEKLKGKLPDLDNDGEEIDFCRSSKGTLIRLNTSEIALEKEQELRNAEQFKVVSEGLMRIAEQSWESQCAQTSRALSC